MLMRRKINGQLTTAVVMVTQDRKEVKDFVGSGSKVTVQPVIVPQIITNVHTCFSLDRRSCEQEQRMKEDWIKYKYLRRVPQMCTSDVESSECQRIEHISRCAVMMVCPPVVFLQDSGLCSTRETSWTRRSW